MLMVTRPCLERLSTTLSRIGMPAGTTMVYRFPFLHVSESEQTNYLALFHPERAAIESEIRIESLHDFVNL